MAYPLTNRLLDALPPDVLVRLRGEFTAVPLPVHTVLFESMARPRYAHFITSGIASVVCPLTGGAGIEVGLVGREGFPEKLHLLGPLIDQTRCFMQVSGTALRIPFKRLEELAVQDPSLQRLILRLVQCDVLTLSQLSACNRMHEVKERLARWLLMIYDRTGEPGMDVTQEFLGEMLGARRSTVNLVAGSLQRAGLIDYRRSYVEIVNRRALEDTACECYGVTHRLLEGLFREKAVPEPSSLAAAPKSGLGAAGQP